ncbi:MAG: hypothetical protein K2Y27_06745 [Xanthobacteraceae bacterium]|nr:hypothetical protein [Xanthobacteraceae bacterium]
MPGTGNAAGAAALLLTLVSADASAQVMDATYRGTLVCDRTPFTKDRMREAIEVTISGSDVRYAHVVRLRDVAEPEPERGTGTLNGLRLELQGAWKDDARRYEARYGGVFVRRSAKLKGTQTWTEGGRTVTRHCAGAIKRPLRAFLPRKRT